MAASYPSSAKSFSTKTDGAGQTIFAAHVNDIQDEVVAVENGLLSGVAHIFKPLSDNLYDLGTSALAWRDAFIKRNLTHLGFAGTGAALVSNASKQIVEQALTNGQLVIGSTGAAPVAAAIAAGTGITITNAAGSITITATAAGVLDRQVAVQEVTGTSAETAVYTFAVPGATLGSTKTLHLSLIGDAKNNSGGNITITVRVKYGATTIFQAAFTNVNTGAAVNALILDTELTAANATGAQRAKTVIFYDGVATGNVGGVAATRDFVGGNDGSVGSVGGTFGYAVHNAVAEDSTASKNLVVTLQSSSASGSVSLKAHTVYVELK